MVIIIIIDTFNCWQIFQACKLHYNTSYNMSKYGYNIKSTSWSNFQKVKNKRIFTTLAKRYKDQYPDFVKFSLYGNEDVNWVGDLQDDDIVDQFWEHQKYIQNASYYFQKDLDGIFTVIYNNQLEFKDVFIDKDVEKLPIIERLYIQKLISIETLLILDRLVHWMDKVYCDNPIWESSRLRKMKLNPFISLDNEKLKKVLLKKLNY